MVGECCNQESVEQSTASCVSPKQKAAVHTSCQPFPRNCREGRPSCLSGRESEKNRAKKEEDGLGEAGAGPHAVSDLMPSLLGAAGSTQEREGKAWKTVGSKTRMRRAQVDRCGLELIQCCLVSSEVTTPYVDGCYRGVTYCLYCCNNFLFFFWTLSPARQLEEPGR